MDFSLASPGFLFVGTGVSTSIPTLEHVMKKECPVCMDALNTPASRNCRYNVSILVQYPENGHIRRVLIDMGKSFREAFLKVIAPRGIQNIDGYLITHYHADAFLGIDDLRELQDFDRPLGVDSFKKWDPKVRPPLFMSKETENVLKSQFPYIYEASQHDGPFDRKIPCPSLRILNIHAAGDTAERPDVHAFESFDFMFGGSASSSSIRWEALAVWHGNDFSCLGFSFGQKGSRVVYLSDVSEVPETVDARIREEEIEVLVLDSLHWEKSHFSHFSVLQAMNYAAKIQPKKLFLIGMDCDVGIHDEINERLKNYHQELKQAYEGDNWRWEEAAFAYDGEWVGLPQMVKANSFEE